MWSTIHVGEIYIPVVERIATAFLWVELPQSLKLRSTYAACRFKELAALAGTTLTYSISTSKGDNEDFVQIVPDRTEHDSDDGEEECFLVACPDGVVPGDVVYVTSPLGQEIELTVPEVHCTCTLHVQ